MLPERPKSPCRLFVVTGGPGAGKTTLLESLEETGAAIAPEAGRAIIRTQRAIGGAAVPDRDAALYAELMLCWDLRSYHAAEPSRTTFFDRGIPDTVGYLRLIGRPVPAHMQKAAETFRYADTAFILPPWPDIFTGDAERSQTLEEAERTFEAIRAVYRELGYTLLPVPRLSVEARRDWVLKAIDRA
ncbi:AAA family ATPase [Chelativorans sp. AA-79]|uniref:AAA family ATPase n=1 Tax=Chelativorans sp. AA-79 TaxID=3028735 RepID=UPI0023F6E955|nr:AAA family ATPase [Chelativorans sp. AA-79]WEX11378.1 AAA family ATPase [Chelativorans sp. AA-79]